MFKKRLKPTPATAGILIAFYSTMTPILAKPKPNTAGVKNEAKPWLDSFTDICLWAIPLVAVIASAAHGLSWMVMDEDEKKQKPVLKMLKIIWGIAVVLELIPTIYKIYNM